MTAPNALPGAPHGPGSATGPCSGSRHGTGPRSTERMPLANRFRWANLPVENAGASRVVRRSLMFGAILLLCLAGALSARADDPATDEIVSFDPVELLTADELRTLVGRVALYPDDLLAIVLPASTFPLQVVLAARYLEAREAEPSLEPDPEWDASIIALLNYPEILALLDRDLEWTWELGEAVLLQQEDLIAAVADFRELAAAAGNLESDDKQVVSVSAAGAIEIVPVEREVIHVPYYDPVDVVVYQPRRVYHYYPRAYPVYYYPYPSGHYFSNGAFWGVTSAFSIGWHSRSLHWHHHGFHDHPYFGYAYYDPFYYRRPHVWISYHQRDRLRRHDRRHHDGNRWQNDDRRGHSRPGRRPGRGDAGTRSESPDGRASDRGVRPTPAGARGIERTLVAMPGKKSGLVPVNRKARPASSPASRAESAEMHMAGIRRLTSASRSPSPGDTAGRQRNIAPRASSTSAAAGLQARTAPRDTARLREDTGRGASAPARSLRQPRSKPVAAPQPRRITTPIRKPTSVQRSAVSPRAPVQARSPRATRPAAVRQPAKIVPPRTQQRQRPRISSSYSSSLGDRAAARTSNSFAAATRAVSGATVNRSAARPAPQRAQAPSRRSEPVRPRAAVSAGNARERQSRLPNRRRPER